MREKGNVCEWNERERENVCESENMCKIVNVYVIEKENVRDNMRE